VQTRAVETTFDLARQNRSRSRFRGTRCDSSFDWAPPSLLLLRPNRLVSLSSTFSRFLLGPFRLSTRQQVQRLLCRSLPPPRNAAPTTRRVGRPSRVSVTRAAELTVLLLALPPRSTLVHLFFLHLHFPCSLTLASAPLPSAFSSTPRARTSLGFRLFAPSYESGASCFFFFDTAR
jgi:hypothetical protein